MLFLLYSNSLPITFYVFSSQHVSNTSVPSQSPSLHRRSDLLQATSRINFTRYVARGSADERRGSSRILAHATSHSQHDEEGENEGKSTDIFPELSA